MAAAAAQQQQQFAQPAMFVVPQLPQTPLSAWLGGAF
jgi:hypothetical protein